MPLLGLSSYAMKSTSRDLYKNNMVCDTGAALPGFIAKKTGWKTVQVGTHALQAMARASSDLLCATFPFLAFCAASRLLLTVLTTLLLLCGGTCRTYWNTWCVTSPFAVCSTPRRTL